MGLSPGSRCDRRICLRNCSGFYGVSIAALVSDRSVVGSALRRRTVIVAKVRCRWQVPTRLFSPRYAVVSVSNCGIAVPRSASPLSRSASPYPGRHRRTQVGIAVPRSASPYPGRHRRTQVGIAVPRSASPYPGRHRRYPPPSSPRRRGSSTALRSCKVLTGPRRSE
jgi:hypothetical protein